MKPELGKMKPVHAERALPRVALWGALNYKIQMQSKDYDL
jgi:hypothetical protein